MSRQIDKTTLRLRVSAEHVTSYQCCWSVYSKHYLGLMIRGYSDRTELNLTEIEIVFQICMKGGCEVREFPFHRFPPFLKEHLQSIAWKPVLIQVLKCTYPIYFCCCSVFVCFFTHNLYIYLGIIVSIT